MMLNQNTGHVQVSHLHGIRAEQMPYIFSLKPTPVSKHLLEKSTNLLLDDSNAARFYPHLPPELITVFGQTHWMLASLSNSQRVVMLIAADQATTSLHPATVQGFKKTLECIERALVLFSSRKR
jgi:hypothetical protein